MPTSTSSASPALTPITLAQDAQTIGLVGLLHGGSHFFHLLLPPLFPWLVADFGWSYSELGVLVSVFFVVSGVGQALAGFLVDRVGARPVLLAALVCFFLAAVTAGLATGYAGLWCAAALAGLGNAPFHPVDFTILNRRVSPARLGHGFAVHGMSGNLGWAAAPLFLVGLTTTTGSWRMACFGAAGIAALLLLLALWQRDALDDQRIATPADRNNSTTGKPTSSKAADQTPVVTQEHPMAFLRLPSVWLCFSFFFWSTCALTSIQTFASPALQALYALPLSITGLVVTGYMLCGVAGMVMGGFLAGRVQRLETLISCCLLVAALLLALGGTGWFSGHVTFALVILAGIGTGLAGPSRDMLIKQAAPPGATGRVYGTVYSGLDLGFAVAAPVLGAIMDRQWFAGIFYSAAIALGLGVVSAVGVGMRVYSKRSHSAN